MSPAETIASDSRAGSPWSLPWSLDEYAITSDGFLPEELPLRKLPNPYYGPWEALVESLPAALASRTLRDQVHRLPVLSTEHLSTEPEWRRACVILGFLAHAYIWGGATAAEVLPPQLAVPFLAATAHFGLPPVATFASLNLWNFEVASPGRDGDGDGDGPDLTDLDALRAQHTFTGTEDESWFYVISVAMEAEGARLIPVLLRALHALSAAPSPDTALTTSTTTSTTPTAAAAAAVASQALRETAACVERLGRLLERMDERCRPDLRGGSNGQSSLVQFLDLALGVDHVPMGDSNSNSGSGSGSSRGKPAVGFHEEVRGYMPEPHRRFLEDVAARHPGGLKKGVERLLATGGKGEGAADPLLAEVREAFRAATRALAEFRNKHLQMVTRYIIIPSRQPNNKRQEVNLATASSKLRSSSSSSSSRKTRDTTPAGGGGELTGTGGTALIPFLKQTRDETVKAGQLECQ
ncbi:hypothetical protein VTH06DRAFT_4727 [Thermothelomyces fergusii]